MLASTLFAPKPREPHVSARTQRVLELARETRAAASSSATAGAAFERAAALCQKLAWPACDPATLREMGKAP